MGRLDLILAVAVGGALGSLGRYSLSRWLNPQVAAGFPVGTFVANMAGCLAIGFCFVWFEQRGALVARDGVRYGLLGGLTTFSTYCIESIVLFEKGHHALAVGNALGSLVGGLVAAVAGIALGRLVLG